MATADESAAPSADWTTIDSVTSGTETLIVVSGELDLLLHDELRAALSSASQTNLTVDLTHVSFIDVPTIALHARAPETRVGAGRRTAIVNCQPQVRRVF